MTHPVSVYFIQADDGGPIKIGFAVDPEARLRGLQIASLIADVLATEGTLTLREALHLASMLNAPAGEVDRETFVALNAAKRAYLAAYSTWDVLPRTQMLEQQIDRLRPRTP